LGRLVKHPCSPHRRTGFCRFCVVRLAFRCDLVIRSSFGKREMGRRPMPVRSSTRTLGKRKHVHSTSSTNTNTHPLANYIHLDPIDSFYFGPYLPYRQLKLLTVARLQLQPLRYWLPRACLLVPLDNGQVRRNLLGQLPASTTTRQHSVSTATSIRPFNEKSGCDINCPLALAPPRPEKHRLAVECHSETES